nr:hypothetical protein [Tanacetum cinerariifolium]
MDTTIDQQVTIDEALVPHAKRLRIGRSSFRVLLDIKSKESTLQLVYDVLRITPFFKAFLVTAIVPEIYMQEFWATATVHHHAIRFKMDNKKHIVNLESFRDMLHICPRVPGQSFVEPPFEEEILAFICFLGHSAAIRTLTDVNINKLYQPWRSFAAIINKCLTGKSSGYDSLRLFQAQVEHKDHKKSNEMYYPRFTKVIIHHFMSKDPFIPRRNKVNWHYVRDDHMFPTIKLVSKHQNMQQFGALLPIELTNEEIRNSNAYKEYYAVATGATPPKAKASVWRTRSSSDTIITPPTAAADEGDDEGKDGDGDDDDDNGDDGKQRDGNDDDEDDDGTGGDDDNDDDQEVVREDKEGDEKDDEEEGGDEEQEYDEETRDEESFDPILKTPKNSNDEGNGEEDLGLNVGREEGHDEEEEEDELYIDQSSSVSSQFGTSMLNPTLDVAVQLQSDKLREEAQKENDEFLKTIDENIQKIIKKQVKEQFKVQVSKILPRIEQTMNEQIESKVLTRSCHSSKTSYDVAADISEMELKKILIEKMEGNKKTVTLKRRRDGDADKDKQPSAGPDRGSKRRRKGKELDESATAEEPMQTIFQMDEPTHPEFETDRDWNKTLPATYGSIQPWISEPAKRSESRSSFNKPMDTPLDFSTFLINRLKVDTLTPELIAGPTYELLKGSCKSLVELEYHLEEVYKATTDQLDWVNLEGQQYPHNLLKPLPLIPNNRGRRVILFDHFINNDLEYLCGGASSRKYTTSVTKTKAADYGHIKWIEDLVPRTMWIEEPIGYDKHALWEVSIGGVNNKDKKNRLMRIDELHKFSNGTLTDVRTALDDHIKGIRMHYLPQSIRRKRDKDRAVAMIQTIDKRLKTRRIMRNLERIPLLYRGEYSQWVERFMNYLEEQTYREAMINSIKNGDQPLPRVTQVFMVRTSSTEQPPLKDKSMWSDQEKRVQKIDRLARSLLIQGLPNDIYSLIDSNKTAKDLWDALARHMLGLEYGEQDKKAAWKQYATMMRQNKNLMDINIDALYNFLKQNQGDVNDAMGSKKKTVVVTSDPLALIAEKTNVSRSKEKKTKMMPAKKDKDEQVLLAEDQAWMESSSDSDQEINANMVFMAQIKKVLSNSEASSSSADEKISE